MRLSPLSRLAHDMRSSLTSIKEGISLVSDGTLGSLNPRQKRCLKIAEDGIVKVVSLIDRLPRSKKRRRTK